MAFEQRKPGERRTYDARCEQQRSNGTSCRAIPAWRCAGGHAMCGVHVERKALGNVCPQCGLPVQPFRKRVSERRST